MTHPARAPFGAIDASVPGFRIRVGGPDAKWPLIVESDEPRPDWLPHDPGYEASLIPTSVEMVIIYKDEGYRIHEAEAAGRGWVYRLRPIPPNDPWRRTFELSREKVEKLRAEQAEFKRIMKQADRDSQTDTLRGVYNVVNPDVFTKFFVNAEARQGVLYGWLPVRAQRRLAERIEIDPECASRYNALFQFVFFSPVSLFWIVLFGGWLATSVSWWPLIILGYMGLEGLLRFIYITGTSKPCGWPPLEILDWVWRSARGIREEG